MSTTMTLEQILYLLAGWLVYFAVRDQLARSSGSMAVFWAIVLLPADLCFYYPLKAILVVFPRSKGAFLLKLMTPLGKVIFWLLGFLFRALLAFPRRIRFLPRGWEAAFRDQISCQYCEAPLPTMLQRQCPDCKRVFIGNLMELCRCRSRASKLLWIDCPQCGCSNDLR